LNRPARVNPHLAIESYDPEADRMALNMGPQHPSTHGVFRIKLFIDGETIVKAVPYPGYLHRGVDKHDYVAPMTNEQAICHAFEVLSGTEVPRRARWMRSLLAEMQRVASHLLWLGTFVLDIGGTIGGGASIMMYTFRERENILDLFEDLTGGRFHYNTGTVGGNRHDIPADWAPKVKTVFELIRSRVEEYHAEFTDNAIFHDRT